MKPGVHQLGSDHYRDVLGRFWSHVTVGEPDDCWLWTASTDRRGYGLFSTRSGKHVRANRFALEIADMAPIPPGLLSLHSCDTPGCVNPAHLRVGTDADNQRDCLARGRHPLANRTHCRHGHPFDEANTRHPKEGGRKCRTCDRIQSRQRYSVSDREALLNANQHNIQRELKH